jgi:hypothetical protein
VGRTDSVEERVPERPCHEIAIPSDDVQKRIEDLPVFPDRAYNLL